MKFKTRFFVLPAACLSLTMFGLGCDSSTVNEAGSTSAKEGSAVTPVKQEGPPPNNYTEFYKRELDKAPSKKKGAASGGGAAPKGGEAPKGDQAEKP